MLDGNIARISRIPPDKAERILDAGMREFCRGFKVASTDVIADRSGISKGLLFHYFGTKSSLFWFLLRSAAALVSSKFISLIDFGEPDLLRRLLQTTYLRLEFCGEHPAVLGFVSAVSRSTEPAMADAKAWLSEKLGVNPTDESFLYSGVAMDRFRPDIDPDDAAAIIRHAATSFLETELAKQAGSKPALERVCGIMDGLQRYVDLFRKTFYAIN